MCQARGYPKNWVLDMPLQQSGPDGWCQVYSRNASYNAQVTIWTFRSVCTAISMCVRDSGSGRVGRTGGARSNP